MSYSTLLRGSSNIRFSKGTFQKNTSALPSAHAFKSQFTGTYGFRILAVMSKSLTIMKVGANADLYCFDGRLRYPVSVIGYQTL